MNLKVNDIIQIKPAHEWGCCLAYVEEVKSFGCLAYVEVPMQGRAYVRLLNEDFVQIGMSISQKEG